MEAYWIFSTRRLCHFSIYSSSQQLYRAGQAEGVVGKGVWCDYHEGDLDFWIGHYPLDIRVQTLSLLLPFCTQSRVSEINWWQTSWMAGWTNSVSLLNNILGGIVFYSWIYIWFFWVVYIQVWTALNINDICLCWDSCLIIPYFKKIT